MLNNLDMTNEDRAGRLMKGHFWAAVAASWMFALGKAANLVGKIYCGSSCQCGTVEQLARREPHLVLHIGGIFHHFAQRHFRGFVQGARHRTHQNLALELST